jgi:hypothetical protein
LAHYSGETAIVVTPVTAVRRAPAYLAFIGARRFELNTEEQDHDDDQIFLPDAGLHDVLADDLRCAEPSRSNHRLSSSRRFDQTHAHEEIETKMTKFYALLAAAIVFAPVVLIATNQAAQIVS